MYRIQGGELNSKEISTAWRHRRPEEILKAINGSRKRGGDLERKEQISKSNERSRRQRGDLKGEQDEHFKTKRRFRRRTQSKEMYIKDALLFTEKVHAMSMQWISRSKITPNVI